MNIFYVENLKDILNDILIHDLHTSIPQFYFILHFFISIVPVIIDALWKFKWQFGADPG